MHIRDTEQLDSLGSLGAAGLGWYSLDNLSIERNPRICGGHRQWMKRDMVPHSWTGALHKLDKCSVHAGDVH